jgi:pimeloyl-ACP methyl ester carboxylesterase
MTSLIGRAKAVGPFSLALFLTLGACTGDEAVDVTSPALEPTAAAARVVGPASIQGEIGPGSLYELFVPADWNGDLVLYAHGYRAPRAPIALPRGGVEGLKDALLSMGYGVAWSSYSENGYAVRDGVIRTRQLRGIFASKVGKPDRTYIIGHSLGGMVTLMSAEKNPGLYDGAMPMCGFLGGGPLEVDYIQDVRVLFDYFFPDVIPGDAMNVPEGLDFGTQVIPAVIQAVSANFPAALELAAVDQIDLPYTNPAELINSILSTLFFNVVGTEDFDARIHRPYYSNTGRMYTGSSNDEALNAGVDRFESSPAGDNYLKHWYEPDGKLDIPVLSLHTSMDAVVPLFHEPAYAEIVAAAGRSDMLVQRTVNRYGHCAFTGPEQIGAFLDLVTWVETGVAPTP